MSLVDTEQVLVVPTELFHELGYFQGFSHDADRYFDDLLSPENTSYRPRGAMEVDPKFKQLIPYVVFRYIDPAGNILVFQYTRGKGQGEKRLHLKRSVGIGGHICSDDDRGAAELHPYQEGMQRELAEEVAIETKYEDHMVGLINDDETEVGRVHLGIVHVFDVESPAIKPRETDLIETGFRPAPQLFGELDQFESWSRICLDALFGQE
jgi:predicted NUDIX family phosphoesterase